MHRVSVRLGEWNTETEEDCTAPNNCTDPPVNIDIEEIIPHQLYDEAVMNRPNDIGLVRLRKAVQFTSN